MGIYTTAVEKLYVAYFNRPADAAGLAYWESVVTAAKGSTAAVSAAFAASAEYKATFAGQDEYHVVATVYQNLFGRAAEPAGLAYWGQALINKTFTIDSVVTQIAAGAQGTDLAAYNNKVTAATAFSAALDTTAEILAYSGDKANVAAKQFMSTITTDASLAAALVPAAMDAAVAVVVLAGTPVPVVTTVSLTSGVDTIVGDAGYSAINATLGTGATLTGFDSIDAGAGNDTLNIVDATTTNAIDTTVLSLTIKNVETANVQGLDAVTVDSSSWSGLTALNITASKGTDIITAAGTTAVSVVDSLGTVAVSGGSTVSVTTDATSAVSVAGTAGKTTSVSIKGGAAATIVDGNSSVTVVAAGIVPAHTAPSTATANTITTVSVDSIGATAVIDSDALTSLTVANTAVGATVNAAAATRTLGVTLNKATGGSITDATATTVNVTGTGASSTVTLAAAAAKSVSIAGDKAVTLTSLNAAAMTALAVSDSALATISAFGTTNKLAAVTVTGSGGLKADLSGQTVLASVDASASTGTNTVTLNAALTAYTGGSGNDIVTVGVAPTVAINGGAGSTDVIVENAATDILVGNTKISGFETLGLGAATTGAYDTTGFTHLLVGGTTTAGVSFVNVAAGADLAIVGSTGQTVTYALANALGTADAMALNLSAGATAANSVTAAGIETVNISLTDTNSTAGHAAFAETLTLSAAAAKAITVAGNGTMGLTLMDTDTAITSLDASGLVVAGTGAAGTGLTWTTGNFAAAATIKGSANGGDVIDASAAAKAVTITETAGTNTITGGAVADTLTGGTGADTINGGAGNDIIVGGGGADVITGGAGVDVITVSGTTSKIVQSVGSSGTNTSTTIQTAELTSTFDVVKGFAAGDKIDFGNANIVTGTATLAGTNLAAGAADTVVFASGTYDAAAGTFTFAANGADTAVTYDSSSALGVTAETIILVGYHAGSTTVAAAGIVTLG